MGNGVGCEWVGVNRLREGLGWDNGSVASEFVRESVVDEGWEDEGRRLLCERDRECRLFVLKEGSREIVILLFVRLSAGLLVSGVISSLPFAPLAHFMPNSKGLARGEPLTLSMLSSLRGMRMTLLFGGLLPG